MDISLHPHHFNYLSLLTELPPRDGRKPPSAIHSTLKAQAASLLNSCRVALFTQANSHFCIHFLYFGSLFGSFRDSWQIPLKLPSFPRTPLPLLQGLSALGGKLAQTLGGFFQLAGNRFNIFPFYTWHCRCSLNIYYLHFWPFSLCLAPASLNDKPSAAGGRSSPPSQNLMGMSSATPDTHALESKRGS